MILAIVLSAAVLFGWSAVADRFFPQPKPAPEAAQPAASGQNGAAPALPGVPGEAAAPKLQDRAKLLASATRVAIETPALKGSINLAGGQLDDLVLEDAPARRHRESAHHRILEVVLRPGHPMDAPQIKIVQMLTRHRLGSRKPIAEIRAAALTLRPVADLAWLERKIEELG